MSVQPLSIISIIALAMVCGCAPKGAYQQAEVTTRSMASTRAELQSAKSQADVTVAALDDLVNNPQADMKKQYATFASAVDSLNKSYERTRDRAYDARAKREEYLTQWKVETQEISSPDLQSRAADRRQDARASFDQLRTRLDAVNTTSQPFVSSMNDLRRYLGNDLTPAGVQSVSDLVSRTRQEAAATKRSIDEAIADIDRVNAEMAPSASQPAK